MPLLPASLQTSLQSLSASPGATIADCAQLWANAIQSYAAPIAPPSTTVAAAGAALASQLAAAFALTDATSAMDAAFTAFAATLGVGMLPGFAAVPPPAPLNITSLCTEPYPETAADFAQKWSAAIDAWMRTGTATPVPSGGPIPWS